MSLSSSTLSAIQKAGAAAFTADVKLKNAVKEYAERVNAAIATNPYNLGNDALFENWKVVARLSQTLMGIEEELQKVYRLAAELTADDQPSVREVPALAAPTRATVRSVRRQDDLTPTDVLAKTKKKTSTSKTKTKIKIKVSPSQLAAGSGSRLEPSGNAAKLLQHFERVLNSNEFTEISQTAAGHETGIPTGSMTAATKKLMEMGRIIAGPTGSFKLAHSQPPLAA